MTTARDVITRSFKLIGAIGEGESPTAEAAQDALAAWNAMLSSWSLEANLVYGEARESFPLTEGVAAYTIGAGGDFNTTRPERVLSAFIRDASNLDTPVTIIGAGAYGMISDKSVPTQPVRAYLDSGFPLRTFTFESLPTAGLTFHLITEKPLDQIPDLNTVLIFPPGYELAHWTNLALTVAPYFEIDPAPRVKGMAATSLRRIKTAIARTKDNTMRCDPGLVSIGADADYGSLSGSLLPGS